jgi:hypothetical protein
MKDSKKKKGKNKMVPTKVWTKNTIDDEWRKIPCVGRLDGWIWGCSIAFAHNGMLLLCAVTIACHEHLL